MFRDRLQGKDLEMYDLVLSYYSMKSGCLGVIYALSKKGSEERKRHFIAINEKAGLPSYEVVEMLLTAVIYSAVDASSFEEAVDKVKEACQHAEDKRKKRQGPASARFERDVVKIIRLALIALCAWWDKYRPQTPLSLPAEIVSDNL